MERIITLESGRWHVRLAEHAQRREYLHLTSAAKRGDSMRVALPFSWRHLDDDELTRLARKPEVRIWCDEHEIRWRIATVGPGTPYPFPFPGRYLVYDSEQTWSGIVAFDSPRQLGDLTEMEMRELRDHMSDFGGSREGFRAPAASV